MTVSELLDGQRCYAVPAYQRPYSWGAEQAGSLISDLLERYRQSKSVAKEDIWPLFLGSVVVSSAPEAQRLKVIDGQQRLITLTILLAVLRDLGEPSQTADLTSLIERGAESGNGHDEDSGHEADYCVHPRPIDRPFFAECVQEPGATTSIPAGFDPMIVASFQIEPPLPDEIEVEDDFDIDEEAEPEFDIEEDLTDIDPDFDKGAAGPHPMVLEGEQATADANDPSPNGELSDSQRRMLINREFLRLQLQALEGTERRELTDFLKHHCEMIVTIVARPEYASNVFLSIHRGGVDLNDSDILKAEMLSKVPDAEIEELGAKWDAIEALLGRNAFSRLFSHLRLIGLRRRRRTTTLEEIRLAYAPADDPAGFVEGTLRQAAERYFQIRKAAYRPGTGSAASSETCNEINRYLMYLAWNDSQSVSDIESWVPPVLQFLMKYGDQPDAVLDFLRSFERLVASLTIRRIVDPQRSDRYVAVLASIDRGGTDIQRSWPMRLTDRDKRNTFRLINSHRFGRFACCKLVLMRLEAHLDSAARPEDYKNCTIEHILPKHPRPGSDWMQTFPDKKAVSENTDRLGNLCLLSRRENHAADNCGFADKLQIYFADDNDSPFALKEELRNTRSWRQRDVDQREKTLLRAVKRMWRLEHKA